MAYENLDVLLPRLLKGGPSGQVRLFVDTCFALNEEAFAALDDRFFSTLKASRSDLVLPLAVLREIQKHERTPKDIDLADRAKFALTRFASLEKNRTVRIVGSKDDPFADQTFLEVFTKFRPKYTLLLFTQDSGLSRDLLQINDHESTNRTTNKVLIARYIPRQGIVVFNDRAQFEQRVTRQSHGKPPASRAGIGQERSAPPFRFRTFKAPRSMDDQVIGDGASYAPRSTVYSSNRQSLLLGASIAQGGEGQIFEVDSNRVAKIYFHDRRTVARRDKLQLMCRHPVTIRGVAWPLGVLNDASGNFLGYIMPKARGHTLQQCVFGKARLAEHFPDWKKGDLIELALTYARAVSQIHQLGLIVGDINPLNVLVVSSREIYIVDVDSFQVEDFPCPVGMVTFRAPEITEPSFAKFLRTEPHEMFALASLLFMILMGGKAPYSYQGGGDPAENIRSGNFPYIKDKSAIPAGAYRYIWSYLPTSIQNAFASTFADPSPNGRPSAEDWVTLLTGYLKLLEREPVGSDAHALWPASFKPWKNSQVVQLKCASCTTNFQTSAKDAEKRKQFPSILCGNCLAVLTLAKEAGDSAKCAKCAKTIRVSFKESSKSVHYCDPCKQTGNLTNCGKCGNATRVPVEDAPTSICYCGPCIGAESVTARSCKECRRNFYIESGEILFFWSKQLNLPRKCGPCRGRPEYIPFVASEVRHTPPTQTYRPPPPSTPPHYSQPSRSFWGMLKDFFS